MIRTALSFFRNMAAFDAGWLVGVITGGVSVAVFMTLPKLAFMVVARFL